MKRPPTVSRGLILRVPYADIRSALCCKSIAADGGAFMYRVPARFEVGEMTDYQPQRIADHVWSATVQHLDYVFDPMKACQVLMATIRCQLRADA